MPLPNMWWRSVYASTNGFAYESFMNEMAVLAGQDQLDFRRKYLKDERCQQLIDRGEQAAVAPCMEGGQREDGQKQLIRLTRSCHTDGDFLYKSGHLRAHGAAGCGRTADLPLRRFGAAQARRAGRRSARW